MSAFRELLGRVAGRFDVPSANSEIGSKDLRDYRARLNPETMAVVLHALLLADLNYTRTNHSQPDLMGDDEHEAWGEVKRALQALNTPTP